MLFFGCFFFKLPLFFKNLFLCMFFFKFSIRLLRSFNNSLFDLEQSFRDFFGNIFSRQVSRGTKCLCQNLSFSFADHSDVCMCRIFLWF